LLKEVTDNLEESAISERLETVCRIFIYTHLGPIFRVYIKKVNLSLYRPWRSFGFREVEAPTFAYIQFTDGGKVVSPTRRLLFTPRKIPGTHFC
jgi:hypothetical protein